MEVANAVALQRCIACDFPQRLACLAALPPYRVKQSN
jgi:hypothetical protein